MRWSVMLVGAVLALLALVAPAPRGEAAADSPILAFYYPWYNPTDFNRSQMFDVPVTPYQSDDPAAIQRQVQQARGAGVTGFISSWWGRGNRTDKNFATLLDASRGTDFASTVYFETGAQGLASEGEIVSQLRYVMSTYGSHPNFAKVGGKPALFFWYPAGAGSLENWRRIRSQVDPNGAWHWNVETDRPDSWLDVFDGIHLFSAASWTADATSTYKSLKSKVDAAAARTGKPKVWAAGVAPGWDNTRQGNPTKVLIGRNSGAYYSQRWDSALVSEPGVITITSWNEWGEGTAIEPGTGYGNLYLDITKEKAARFRGSGVSQAVSLFPFKLGFKLLADQISSVVGGALQEEHYGANGDSLQQTTNGLLVWRKADNWTAFTDGATTWVNGPNGIQTRPNNVRFSWEAR